MNEGEKGKLIRKLTYLHSFVNTLEYLITVHMYG